MVEEHLKTTQPMIPNDVQTLIDEPEEPLLVTEEQQLQQQSQQPEEMSGMGGTHVTDDFDLAFDQAFDNQGFQQQQQSSAFGMTSMNETGATPATIGGQQQQQQQGFFGFQ